MTISTHRPRIYVVLFYLFLFMSLIYLVMSQNVYLAHWDLSIQKMFQGWVNPMNTRLFTLISFFGSPIIALIGVAMLLSWLLIQRNLKVVLWMGSTVLFGNASAFLLKFLVHRLRPIHEILPDTGYSFPSGHVFATTLLVFCVLYLILPKVRDQETRLLLTLLGIVWIVLVSFSRIYLRDHFGSDIIASLLLAAIWWKVAQWVYVKFHIYEV